MSVTAFEMINAVAAPDVPLGTDARLGFLVLIVATAACALYVLFAALAARSHPVVAWTRDPGGGGTRKTDRRGDLGTLRPRFES